MDSDQAWSIGIAAVTFLAEDPGRLSRFLALTGTGPDELRRQAGTPELMAAVLNHLLEDESLLLVFAAMKGIAALDVAPAARALSGNPLEDAP